MKELKIMRNEVNRAHKAKKALRYLLIVMSLVSVLSVEAQSTAQLPELQMQSTSVMAGSGSTLPQAAATGATLAGETPGTNSPASSGRPGHLRKGLGEGDGDINKPGQPFPVGDAMWPLMLCALAYLIIRVGRKRTRA